MDHNITFYSEGKAKESLISFLQFDRIIAGQEILTSYGPTGLKDGAHRKSKLEDLGAEEPRAIIISAENCFAQCLRKLEEEIREMVLVSSHAKVKVALSRLLRSLKALQKELTDGTAQKSLIEFYTVLERKEKAAERIRSWERIEDKAKFWYPKPSEADYKAAAAEMTIRRVAGPYGIYGKTLSYHEWFGTISVSDINPGKLKIYLVFVANVLNRLILMLEKNMEVVEKEFVTIIGNEAVKLPSLPECFKNPRLFYFICDMLADSEKNIITKTANNYEWDENKLSDLAVFCEWFRDKKRGLLKNYELFNTAPKRGAICLHFFCRGHLPLKGDKHSYQKFQGKKAERYKFDREIFERLLEAARLRGLV